MEKRESERALVVQLQGFQNRERNYTGFLLNGLKMHLLSFDAKGSDIGVFAMHHADLSRAF